MTKKAENAHAMLAQFDTPADFLRAAEKVRDAGYRDWDTYSPFPVHGMDAAMGLSNSRVGWFCFFGGLTGFTLGMLIIWYMNAYDYPIVVGGKPLFSPIFSFPVAYELTILLGAFGALGGMLVLNRLPRLHHPLLQHERFAAVTHDKLFIVIECGDPSYSPTKTRSLLEKIGGQNIELVEE